MSIELPPCRASYGGHADVASLLLLSAGADVGARTADGWTPLHSAARWNAFACVELLLAQGGTITTIHLPANKFNYRTGSSIMSDSLFTVRVLPL